MTQARDHKQGKLARGLAAGAGLAAAVAGLALLPGCTLEDHYKFSESSMETKSFPVAGVDRVEMRLGAADIDVVSKEGPEAEFIIKRTYHASDEAYGRKILREAVVAIDREGSSLVLKRKEGTKITDGMLLKGYVSIEITATLPPGLALDVLTGSGDLDIDNRAGAILIRSGSGDVTVAGAAGGIEARTGSGDIRVQSAERYLRLSSGSGDLFLGKIAGDTEVSTGSGEINLESSQGTLSIATGSGDVTVAASSGEAIVKTGSGEIEMRGHSGGAEVSASSGNIVFEVAGAEGKVDLTTSSGDIDVTFLGNESAKLDITTMSGTITSKIPLVVKEATRRHLVGVTGDGKMELHIETSSGNVGIVRGSI